MWATLVAGPELADIGVNRGSKYNNAKGNIKINRIDREGQGATVPAGLLIQADPANLTPIARIHDVSVLEEIVVGDPVDVPMMLGSNSGCHGSYSAPSAPSVGLMPNDNISMPPPPRRNPLSLRQIATATPSYKLPLGFESGLLEPEKLRDAQIEQITDADRTAFAVARRLFSGAPTSSGMHI
jgi:hypothetical protein